MTLKRGCPLTEMGASFQIKLRYQNPHKQVVKLLAVIKVNGKTSGLEPGDESEHLIPPFGPKI